MLAEEQARQSAAAQPLAGTRLQPLEHRLAVIVDGSDGFLRAAAICGIDYHTVEPGIAVGAQVLQRGVHTRAAPDLERLLR